MIIHVSLHCLCPFMGAGCHSWAVVVMCEWSWAVAVIFVWWQLFLCGGGCWSLFWVVILIFGQLSLIMVHWGGWTLVIIGHHVLVTDVVLLRWSAAGGGEEKKPCHKLWQWHHVWTCTWDHNLGRKWCWLHFILLNGWGCRMGQSSGRIPLRHWGNTFWKEAVQKTVWSTTYGLMTKPLNKILCTDKSIHWMPDMQNWQIWDSLKNRHTRIPQYNTKQNRIHYKIWYIT